MEIVETDIERGEERLEPVQSSVPVLVVPGHVRVGEFLQVGAGSPALSEGVGGQPDVPPASAAHLDQLHQLSLVQVELPAGESRVVGQGSVPHHVQQVLLAAAPVQG